ncbi:MAG: Hsp20/alpha crystallin family protein [Planctomycetota bacterium]
MKTLIPKRNDPVAFRSEFDDLIERFFEPFEDTAEAAWPAVFRGKMVPAMDVAETEKEFHLTLELPGLDEKDIQIELMGNQLRIYGERKWEHEKKAKDYRRVERRFGNFERVFTLPQNVRLERDAIVATYKKGLLDIKVPKLEPTPAAKITVKSG